MGFVATSSSPTWVGTTRVTATNLLGDLRGAGGVRLRRGAAGVLDRDRLRAAADHG